MEHPNVSQTDKISPHILLIFHARKKDLIVEIQKTVSKKLLTPLSLLWPVATKCWHVGGEERRGGCLVLSDKMTQVTFLHLDALTASVGAFLENT